MSTKALNQRQARWAELLANYDFVLIPIPGTKNPTDGPSRRPDYAQDVPVPTGSLIPPNALRLLPSNFTNSTGSTANTYLQASSERTPSKLSNPLFRNELFLPTPLTLLRVNTLLIHSTPGLVTRMDYSFTKALFMFQLLCVWTSCENTMTHHSPATPALLEPSN